MAVQMRNAIALINELTEEVENLTATVKVRGETIEKLQFSATEISEDNRKLTEKNERLRKPRYQIKRDGTVEMIPTVATVRADTVRKMQELIFDRLDISVEGYSAEEVKSDVRDMVYQIAKEMLEGK